jgi:uroporphyrinogen-III decarboxylase
MTHRDRILAALRWKPVDRVPWVPRLDLWYKAHRYCGTLAGEWADASLIDIVDDLGVGFHAVVPDFLDTEEPDEVCDRVLGIEHVRNQPFRVRFRRTERVVERDGDETRVTYRTPAGTLSGKLVYTEQMRRDGITIMQTTERVVKSLDDYAIVGALFEDIEVEADESRYRAFREEVGDRGIAVAFANVAASPVHHLLKELVPYDQFYYNLYDHPDVIKNTARRMEGYFLATLEACCASSAEVVLHGANYDVSITPPSVFVPHILPHLCRWGDSLHAAGKLLATHTDGENDGLCELFVQAGVDMADSVCPAPMTRLSLGEYRDEFAGKIAIWGGICSVSVLPQSFTDEQFERHIDDALAAVGDGRGLIFSIADTTPPGASIERIRHLGERIAGYHPSA